MTSGHAAHHPHLCRQPLLAASPTMTSSRRWRQRSTSYRPAAKWENTTDAIGQQAQDYMNANPEGNKALMTAALQPRPQAEATLRAYANSNPQQYADFKAILAPLGTLQSQCGVQVVPAQFQWAFDQFING